MLLDADGEALGSLCYREGEVAEEMRWHMWQVLPPRLSWLVRAREALGRAPRWRVAGLVHVYLAPHARGTPAGAALMLGARRCLRRMGVSHELTLADDTGSGKLRRWYEALGYVDASGFMDTAMFARTNR